MKRSIHVILVFALVLGVLLLWTPHVEASGYTPPSMPDPTAVSSIAGGALTSEVVGIAALPGTKILEGGQYSPLGYKDWQAQFGGPGLKISMLEAKTTAKLCFPFPTYRFKWDGRVSQWDGSKWVPLATKFSTNPEGLANWACATGTEKGTYALIIWYYGPIESVMSAEPT